MKSVNFPTLFKMNSNGATQQWKIGVAESGTTSNPTANIVVIYGQLDGKMQSTTTVVKAGKNIGRSNATTPYDQAILEASAKHKKQKDKGYGESLQVARPENKPMLAHKYNDYKHKVTWNDAWAQPKLDGIRCLARYEDGEVKLYSRGNKPITTMGHITKQLKVLMDLYDGTPENHYPVYDGELYIHGEKFQNIVSWVKREQPDSLKIEYHIYDVIDPRPHHLRMTHYDVSSPASQFDLTNIYEVEPEDVYSEEELFKWHDYWVKHGYEGAMLRWDGNSYKEGYRSQQLLKVKRFDEAEFRIIGFKEGKGRFEECCIFELETEDGGKFECLPEGDMELRRRYWRDRESYLGKYITVRYFGLTTSDPPVPRFPIGRAVRDYE